HDGGPALHPVAPGRSRSHRPAGGGSGGCDAPALVLELDLEAGVSAHDLQSPSHRISVSRQPGGVERITLADKGQEALNRDFKLRWSISTPCAAKGAPR